MSTYVVYTVKGPNIQTPKIAVIIIKFDQCDPTMKVMIPKHADGMANSVDPDQTAPLLQ